MLFNIRIDKMRKITLSSFKISLVGCWPTEKLIGDLAGNNYKEKQFTQKKKLLQREACLISSKCQRQNSI